MGENVKLAGGVLLHSILKKYIEPYSQKLSSETSKSTPNTGKARRQDKEEQWLNKIRESARKNVLKVIASCVRVDGECWRDYLGKSLELSKHMMNDLFVGIKNGLHAYDALLDVSFVLRSPGLVGMGSGLFKGIFEVGLQMDWVLGLPFYPGSTIKGAVRSFIEELAKADGKEEVVESIFGGTRGKGMGSLVFYDSYPIGCEKDSKHPCLILTGNVVTPHYYREGKPVESELDANPTPIQHVVVAPGTVFRVIVGIWCPRKKVKENGVEKIVIDEDSVNWLIKKVLNTAPTQERSNSDKCKNKYQYALAIGAVLVAALNRGFAARSRKGYNIMELLRTEDVRDNIVGLALYMSTSQAHSHLGKGGQPEKTKHKQERHTGKRSYKSSYKPR